MKNPTVQFMVANGDSSYPRILLYIAFMGTPPEIDGEIER